MHYKGDLAQRGNVLERVPRDGDDVGIRAGSKDADFPLHIQHFSGARCCGFNRVHCRHAESHHSREFLSDRLGPRNSADIGAKNNFHVRGHGFFERGLMDRGAGQ